MSAAWCAAGDRGAGAPSARALGGATHPGAAAAGTLVVRHASGRAAGGAAVSGLQHEQRAGRSASGGAASLPTKGLFYRWGVDLAGPLVEIPEGYKYCMVTIELFSKHIEVTPSSAGQVCGERGDCFLVRGGAFRCAC